MFTFTPSLNAVWKSLLAVAKYGSVCKYHTYKTTSTFLFLFWFENRKTLFCFPDSVLKRKKSKNEFYTVFQELEQQE